MAVSTFNAVHQKQQIREQLRTVLAACGEMLDAFVSNRMRQVAVEAQPIRSELPTDPADTPVAKFEPLNSSILSDAIPAFFIGRNADGLWVAREARGRTGGLFLLKRSALSFARVQGGSEGCATIFPSETFELDLANEGNRLAPHLALLMRHARSAWQPIDKVTKSVLLRAKDRKAVETQKTQR